MQYFTFLRPSRRGEGGGEWQGGPLWSPAVPKWLYIPSQFTIYVTESDPWMQ